MTIVGNNRSLATPLSQTTRRSFPFGLETDAGLSFLCFCLFYLLRASHFAGDGALIARMTEGGKWLVKNELLSQALLQGAYRIASPFHLTAGECMSALSCVGGALSVWIVLRFGRLYGLNPAWPLLMFLSSGFLLYSCGHTEYYPILLPALLGYGYLGVAYLQGRIGISLVTIAFLWAVGLHFVALLALPSLLFLPLLGGKKKDWLSILVWSMLLVPLVLIRNHPQMLGHKAASLSPAWNFLPWFPHEGMYRYYAVFEWGHLADWFYAWTMRSWIFWPSLLGLLWMGKRTLSAERRFLLAYTIPFTLWTFLWHPDLGIEADWDLFAVEAAPCLLLLLSCLPILFAGRAFRVLFAIACLASTTMGLKEAFIRADFPRAGYGSIALRTTAPLDTVFTVDGLNRPPDVLRIREGIYPGKLIDRTHRWVTEMVLVVDSQTTTRVDYDGP